MGEPEPCGDQHQHPVDDTQFKAEGLQSILKYCTYGGIPQILHNYILFELTGCLVTVQ